MQQTTRMAGSSDQIAAFWRVIREDTREQHSEDTDPGRIRGSASAESRREKSRRQPREG